MPQEPQPALSIGITGHRPNKLPAAAIPLLERQLHETMRAIDDAARKKFRSIRLISNFAEGADQIAVTAAPAHWTIEAILPFPREEFLKDFEQSAAGDGRDVRAEFLASLARAAAVIELPTPPVGPRDDGYLSAGRMMLDRIDLLIAVWDGAEALSGGTGHIVKEAAERKIPVVWLSVNVDRAPVLVQRFQDGSPVIAVEPWPTVLSVSLPARPTRAGRA